MLLRKLQIIVWASISLFCFFESLENNFLQFALLCYFRLITKKKKKTLIGGKYLENVLPLTSAVLSWIPAINA